MLIRSFLSCNCKRGLQTKGNAQTSKIKIMMDLLGNIYNSYLMVIGILKSLFYPLGISQWQAKYLINKNQIKISCEDQRLIDSIKYCQSLYSNDEILKTPELIGRHPLRTENHYLTMKEGGFYPLKAHVLAK